MKNRKITNKQERLNLVTQFIASGQSQITWCKEQDIPASTFAKWVKEYKGTSEKMKLIPLSPKKSSNTIPTNIKASENIVLIEIGPCKIYLQEKAAMTFMPQAMEVKRINV